MILSRLLRRYWLVLILASSGNFPLCAGGHADADRFFEEQIRPLLATHCYSCHGPERQESGLRLDSRAAILAGGDSGETIVAAGQPDESLLVSAVRHEGGYEMPPDTKLEEAQVQALVRWVQAGFPWPASVGGAKARTVDELAAEIRSEHWSLQPVVRPVLPTISDRSWVRGPLDCLVLAKLDAADLEPSPSADPYVLVRRATFDLWGVPPTYRQVQEFVEDTAPGAYERLVDRLLASPRYGERWGRHWLDVARYADTRGYAFGRERRYAYAYTYRDYVIHAFNEDMPFNRFVLEQLAADQLPSDTDVSHLAALGFLTVGRKFNNRHDDIDDQIDVVGRGLLGLTVSCARCHNHKYDPISSEDYYSLYGVFASCHEPEDLPLIGNPEDVPGYEEFKKELDKRTADLAAYVSDKHAELVKNAHGQITDYLVRAISKQPEKLLEQLPFISLGKGELKPQLIARWRQYLLETAKVDHPVWGLLFELVKLPDERFAAEERSIVKQWSARDEGLENGQINPLLMQALDGQEFPSKEDVARFYGDLLSESYTRWEGTQNAERSDEQVPAGLQQLAALLQGDDAPTNIPLDKVADYFNRADRNKYRELQKKIDAHQVNSPGAPPRAMVLKDNDTPHQPRVFIRGNHARLGKEVPRQFLLVLAGDQRSPFTQGSGRRELAEAIIHPANPLTRRVLANRIWMHHFGESLVTTPSDLGTLCDPPLHRELLDYLAWSLAENGWSVKTLHREIMLSSTYRQSSHTNADGLARDPENRHFWRMNRRRLEFESLRDAVLHVVGHLDFSMGGRPVEITESPFSYRRSVYGFIDRQDLPNLFRVFDFASPDQSQAKRPRTTVPQQALFMMNSPFITEQAHALAQTIQQQEPTDADSHIQFLYRRLFARAATDRETEIGARFIDGTAANANTGDTSSAWQRYVQLLMMTNEFTFVD